MKGTLIAIGLLATASLALPAFARGGLHLLDPAWNPQHISGLPAEVVTIWRIGVRAQKRSTNSPIFSEFAHPCLAFRALPLWRCPCALHAGGLPTSGLHLGRWALSVVEKLLRSRGRLTD
jgi:hypothetical protein